MTVPRFLDLSMSRSLESKKQDGHCCGGRPKDSNRVGSQATPDHMIANSGGLFWLDVGSADYAGPLVSVPDDERAEIRSRHRQWNGHQLLKSCFYFWVGQTSINLSVESVDDRSRGAFWRANSYPTSRLIPWHKFTDGWYF